MTGLFVAMGLVVWVVSGLAGFRLILDAWFSGSLSDLRPAGMPLSYIALALVGGPINLLLAMAWIAMGMGREAVR